MPVLIDHELREFMPHRQSAFPVTYFHDELISLPEYTGPLQKLPKGGTALFALLALAGDLGGAAGPALVGYVSQMMAENMQAGILAGTCFPILLAVSVIALKRNAGR